MEKFKLKVKNSVSGDRPEQTGLKYCVRFCQDLHEPRSLDLVYKEKSMEALPGSSQDPFGPVLTPGSDLGLCCGGPENLVWIEYLLLALVLNEATGVKYLGHKLIDYYLKEEIDLYSD